MVSKLGSEIQRHAALLMIIPKRRSNRSAADAAAPAAGPLQSRGHLLPHRGGKGRFRFAQLVINAVLSQRRADGREDTWEGFVRSRGSQVRISRALRSVTAGAESTTFSWSLRRNERREAKVSVREQTVGANRREESNSSLF